MHPRQSANSKFDKDNGRVALPFSREYNISISRSENTGLGISKDGELYSESRWEDL